jgi:hypothetical protein
MWALRTLSFLFAMTLAVEVSASDSDIPVQARSAQPPESVPYRLDIPPQVRAWYRNPDGSCVQCSIGMCGLAQNVPAAYTLLWDTQYGSRVRGGSWPSRVEGYCQDRQIKAFNITGEQAWEWMRWAAKTGRMAAIGAGRRHFQTLYGWDPRTNTWYVCNNNSPTVVDEYSWDSFRRLHLASGQWVVILDYPPSPRSPKYIAWW